MDGALGMARAGEASPCGGEGGEGTGGVPTALTLSEVFPWVMVENHQPLVRGVILCPTLAFDPQFALSWPYALLCSMNCKET